MSMPKPGTPSPKKRERDSSQQDAKNDVHKKAKADSPRILSPNSSSSPSSSPSLPSHFSSDEPVEPDAMSIAEYDADVRMLHLINFEVRAHFKKGFKSTNKIYWDEDAPDISPNRDKKLAITAEKLAKKINKSHSRIADAHGVLGIIRRDINQIGKPPLRVGAALLKMNLPAGNCNEMTKVALTLALDRQVRMAVWILSIGSPGDHVACLFNDGTTPIFANVSHFTSDKSGAWIIDPWANIVCRATEYQQSFKMKMTKWSLNSKYVYFENSEGEGVWEDPASNEYLHAFSCGKLAFTRVQPI